MKESTTCATKSIESKVIQWTGDNIDKVLDFLIGTPHIVMTGNFSKTNPTITLILRSGYQKNVTKNDYIVKNKLGVDSFNEREFYLRYEVI